MHVKNIDVPPKMYIDVPPKMCIDPMSMGQCGGPSKWDHPWSQSDASNHLIYDPQVIQTSTSVTTLHMQF